MQQPDFKNIIFDLGGVILNIDYDKTEKAFIDLGITQFPTLYTQYHASPLFEDFETGRLSPPEFISEFKKLAETDLPEKKIIAAWNAMLLDFPEHRISLLEAIGKNYRIFLLSNTNAIHHDAFHQLFNKTFPGKIFDIIFEKAYYSHVMGQRKPYPECFETVLAVNDLIASETLFIDDSYPNLEGAAQAGIHTLLLNKGDELADYFAAGKFIFP